MEMNSQRLKEQSIRLDLTAAFALLLCAIYICEWLVLFVLDIIDVFALNFFEFILYDGHCKPLVYLCCAPKVMEMHWHVKVSIL